MGGLKILIFFIISFVAQFTIADWLDILGIAPDVIVIFVVSIAIKYGPAAGAFWGFCAGFTQDVYAPVEWLGANSFAMTVLGFVVGQLEARFLTLNLPAKIGVLGIGFIIGDLIFYFFTGLDKETVIHLFLSQTLPECAYTLLIGAIVFHLSIGKKKRNV